MNRHHRSAAAALLTAVLGLFLVTGLVAPAQAATTAKITGTVTDAQGYPLAGVDVTLSSYDGEAPHEVATTRTDGSGRYTFTKVATGPDPYFLELTDPSGWHQPGTIQQFDLTKNVTKNKKLKAAGVIQGKVSTQSGDEPAKPARTVEVTASDDDHFGAVKVSANGHFRIGGLAPGRGYQVQFQDLSGEFVDLCYDGVLWTDGETCDDPVTPVTVRANKAVTLNPQVLDQLR